MPIYSQYLKQWFSIEGYFRPRRYLTCLETFGLTPLGECYWHLAGRGQGGYSTVYEARDSPPAAAPHQAKKYQGQNVSSSEDEKL